MGEFVNKKWRKNPGASVQCSQQSGVDCCDTLRVHNHREYHTIFKKTTFSIKGRPVYWKRHSDKVIWFNGHSWMYGNYADLASGKLNIGFMYPYENFGTMCPGISPKWGWIEWINGSWKKTRASIKCC